jgi:hypothetical protein
VTLRAKTMMLDFEGECRVERTGDSVRLSGLRAGATRRSFLSRPG